MRFIRKPKKRYGTVRKRGYAPLAWKKKDPAKPKWYFVKAGTKCEVRKLGTKEWRKHITSKDILCHHYLWRNETHYGIAFREWEIKVRKELLQ